MDIVIKKIEDLKGYDKNARMHSKQQIKEIANSIKNFGFNDPIEITPDNVILSGHGRLEAALLLKLKEVPTITHSHLTETQRKAYILAANRIALSSTWNVDLLKDEFLDLKEQDFDLHLTGFTTDEISEILDEKIIDEGKSPNDETYNSVFEIIIECNNEDEQESLFNKFQEEGLKCRILSM